MELFARSREIDALPLGRFLSPVDHPAVEAATGARTPGEEVTGAEPRQAKRAKDECRSRRTAGPVP
eukprot:827252-Alexandrium_andersonii.AAC.1